MAAVMRSERASNQRFKEATDWRPRYANARAGWEATAAAWKPSYSGLVARGLAGAIGVLFVIIGCWATFAPSNWYLQFPGFGRQWAMSEPPFNSHLVTDLGGFYLAAGITALVAAAAGRRGCLFAAGLVAAIESVPHFVFHATRHHHFATTADAIVSLCFLVAQFLAGLIVVRLTWRNSKQEAWVDNTTPAIRTQR